MDEKNEDQEPLILNDLAFCCREVPSEVKFFHFEGKLVKTLYVRKEVKQWGFVRKD